MPDRIRALRPARLLVITMLALAVIACGATGTSKAPNDVASPAATSAVVGTASPGSATSPSGPTPTSTPSTSTSPTDSVPDTGGGSTSGDVPDNAVFLTYKGGSPGFSIQYVEGWQVTRGPDGVVIRDKDSSETVAILAPPIDVKRYVASTDLPALQAQAGFRLDKQDTVKVGATHLVHLVYHVPSPPDPVTGKQVPSTVDRYYVPGRSGLAIVSLSTPDGVDNVDAFRQMIESFAWS